MSPWSWSAASLKGQIEPHLYDKLRLLEGVINPMGSGVKALLAGAEHAENNGLRGDSSNQAVLLQTFLQGLIDNDTDNFVPGMKKTAVLPAGPIGLERPIVLRLGATGMDIIGVHPRISTLRASGNWCGPMVLTAPDAGYKGITYAPSLYPDGTASIRFVEAENEFFDLTASSKVILHGLPKFCFDFTVKLSSALGGGSWQLIASHGRRFVAEANDPAKHSLLLFHNLGTVTLRINVGGTQYDLQVCTSPTNLADDNVHRISFEYASAEVGGDDTIRVYLDNVQTDTQVAAGTFQQSDFPFEVGTIASGQPALRMGTTDPKKLRLGSGAIGFKSFGTLLAITEQELAFTATTHDIADPDASPREAYYVVSVNDGGTIAITKGATVVADTTGETIAATWPTLPTGHAAIAWVRIQHDGTAPFDATTDDLDAAHLTTWFGACVPRTEDTIIGKESAFIFLGGQYAVAFTGDWENWRISSNTRWNGTHNPPNALYTWDSDTIWLQDCTQDNDDLLTVARVEGDTKFWMEWKTYILDGFGQKLRMYNVGFHGGARSAWMSNNCTANSSWFGLNFEHGAGYGWMRFNNCFTNYTYDCSLLSGDATRALLIQSAISGAGKMGRNDFTGGRYQHVLVGCSEHADFHFHNVSSSSVCALYCQWGDNGLYSFDDFHCDQEAIGPYWEAGIILSNVGQFRMKVPAVEGQSMPSMKLDTVNHLLLEFGQVNSGFADRVFEIVAPGANPIVMNQVDQHASGTVPLTVPFYRDNVKINAGGHSYQYPSVFGTADATPDVHFNENWLCAASATAITDFDFGADPVPDNVKIEIHFTGARQITDAAGVIELAGGANFTGSADDVLVLRHRDGVWREVSRSVN